MTYSIWCLTFAFFASEFDFFFVFLSSSVLLWYLFSRHEWILKIHARISPILFSFIMHFPFIFSLFHIRFELLSYIVYLNPLSHYDICFNAKNIRFDWNNHWTHCARALVLFWCVFLSVRTTQMCWKNIYAFMLLFFLFPQLAIQHEFSHAHAYNNFQKI